ncbi:hypothetical protein ACC722_38740, partial [Rhizobium ruizarguesonis]
QICEQAYFLRFLPPDPQRKWRHRLAIFLAGPGWVIIGAPKLLAGSFLVVLTFTLGVETGGRLAHVVAAAVERTAERADRRGIGRT